MKVILLLVFLSFGTMVALAAQSTPTIYLSARTDGLPGTGTQSNPINVSTTAFFDAYFKARLATHYVTYLSTDPVTFHFAAGNYTTTGLTAMSGWKLVGAAQNSTVITVTGVTYGSSTIKYVNPVQCVSSCWSSSNIQVKNLTIDGGTRATGTALAAGFTMPAPRQSVTVAVINSSKMAVGRWYYVQDTVMTNGLQKWWGLVTCTAISGNTVTLQNAEVKTPGSVTGDTTAGSAVVHNLSSTENLENGQSISGSAFNGTATIVSVDSSTQVTLSEPAKTTSNQVTFSYQAYFVDSVPGPVLATANIFPAGERAGISLQASNLVVQNVTVQDVAVPFYEGWAGITFNNQAVNGLKVASGNVIDSCTVRDMFGIYSAYISALSDNNYTGDNGTTQQVTITNNVIQGNGYYTGIEFAGNSNSTVQKNQVSNVSTGFFCDTGYNTGITISNNSFSGTNGIHLGPGSPQYFNNTSIQNNIITLTGSNGVGIGLCLNDSNISITGNTVTLQTAANGAYGFMLTTLSPGTTANTVTSNTIVSTVQNIGINTSQNTILTLSQINQKSSSSSSSPKSSSVPGGTSVKAAPGGGAATSNVVATASATTPSSSSSSAADQAQALATQIDAQTTQMAQASATTDSSSAEVAQQQVVQQMSALTQQLVVPGGSSKN